jgi:ABC-2 type transport system ATP-binding protein
VRGVDFAVDDGEIVGFLGPNGAGKTTTLRMLTTLLKPTAGRARIAGADLLRDPVGVRRRIGYVAQAIGASAGGSDPNCRVDEELQIQAQLYRLPPSEAAVRTDLLIRQLELTGLERRLVKTLSGGQRRRLDIALGLVHSPRVVFLDEPTTGLDPHSRSNLWHHIRALRETMGTTIFLSTHYLEEADSLCDRILVIDHGKIIATGSPEALKRRISGDVVTLSVTGDPKIASKVLAEVPAVREITVDGQVLRLSVERGEEALPGMLRALDGEAITMESVQLARPTLDDVFLTLTGRSLRDDSPVSNDGTSAAAEAPATLDDRTSAPADARTRAPANAWPPTPPDAWPPTPPDAWEPTPPDAWPPTSSDARPPAPADAGAPTPGDVWPPTTADDRNRAAADVWPPTPTGAWAPTPGDVWPPIPTDAWEPTPPDGRPPAPGDEDPDTKPIRAVPMHPGPAHTLPAHTELAHTQPIYTAQAYTGPIYTDPINTEPGGSARNGRRPIR